MVIKKAFDCNLCGKSYKQKCSYYRHLENHQKPQELFEQENELKQKYQLDSRLEVQHPDKYPFACTQCDKKYTRQSALTKHISDQHTYQKFRYKCNYCDKKFRYPNTLNDHVRTHTKEEPFGCPRCDRKFKTRSQLRIHVKIDHLKSPAKYQCSFCYKQFHMKCHWVEHLRTHTGEKPYICEFCDKSFSQNSGLQKHIARHTGEGLLKCNSCNKYFADGWNFREHQKSHNREKPYNCSDCDLSYSCKTAYFYHMRKFHNSERPVYQCDYCKKHFYSKTSLREHVKLHMEKGSLGCDYCGKHFFNFQCLKSHILRHVEPTRYLCQRCGLTFSSVSTLNRHQLVHANKPFECQMCPRKFEREVDLEVHVKTIHVVQCLYCSAVFASERELLEHFKRYFRGFGMDEDKFVPQLGVKSKPRECYRCKRKFLSDSSYFEHATRCHVLSYCFDE